MRLLGYGEDALTLAAVTTGLRSFLQQLRDSTDPDGTLVVYHPSFGRRSGVPGKPRSEFGEFDAIVSTPGGTYLVEAKWTASSELQEGVLSLRDEQIRRHRIMRRYIDAWREFKPENWADFLKTPAIEALGQEPGLSVPGPETTLAKNLEFTLQQVRDAGPVRDVLLVSAPGDKKPKIKAIPDGFELVQFLLASAGGAGFIGLSLVAND